MLFQLSYGYAGKSVKIPENRQFGKIFWHGAGAIGYNAVFYFEMFCLMLCVFHTTVAQARKKESDG